MLFHEDAAYQAGRGLTVIPQRLHNSDRIAEGTREPIKFQHHWRKSWKRIQRAALSDLIEKPVVFGPVPASTRGFLAHGRYSCPPPPAVTALKPGIPDRS